MTGEEFAAEIEKLVSAARDDDLSDEAMITELQGVIEALQEGLS
jgi:hypothetical protein